MCHYRTLLYSYALLFISYLISIVRNILRVDPVAAVSQLNTHSKQEDSCGVTSISADLISSIEAFCSHDVISFLFFKKCLKEVYYGKYNRVLGSH